MTLVLRGLETGPLHRFQDWPNEQVPKRAAGVYTVWDGDRLLYVGMSGRAMTAEDLEVSDSGRVVAKGLWTRLNAHASGRRSGDQFCIYISDRFVVPALTPSHQQQLAAGSLSLDSLIRAFVRERLAYRFVVTADGAEAAKLEEEVRRRGLSAGKPYLNPLSRGGRHRAPLYERKQGRLLTRDNAALMPVRGEDESTGQAG
jgi:hypothetical protein